MNVTVITRESNLGSFRSIIGAISDLLAAHHRLIFLEDDNEVSSNFLEYMNHGLLYYDDDPRIFSISGYNYPIRMPCQHNKDVYVWPGFSAWGVGLWVDKWNAIDWELRFFDEFIADTARVREFNRIASHVLPTLLKDRRGEIMAADARICLHIFVNGQLSVFPTISKVRNHGNDGTGEHCGRNNIYSQQTIDDGSRIVVFDKYLHPNPAIYRRLRQHFDASISRRLVKYLHKILRSYSLQPFL